MNKITTPNIGANPISEHTRTLGYIEMITGSKSPIPTRMTGLMRLLWVNNINTTNLTNPENHKIVMAIKLFISQPDIVTYMRNNIETMDPLLLAIDAMSSSNTTEVSVQQEVSGILIS